MKMKRLGSIICLFLCYLSARSQQEVILDQVPPPSVGTVDFSGLTLSSAEKVGGISGIVISGHVAFTDNYTDVLRMLEDTPGWESQLLNITGMSADEYDASEILRKFNQISGIDYQVQFSFQIKDAHTISWVDHLYRTAELNTKEPLILEQSSPADSRLFIPFTSMNLKEGTYTGRLSADVYIQPGNIPAGKHDFGTVSFHIPASRAYIISIENLEPDNYELCLRYGKASWWITADEMHANRQYDLIEGDFPELYALVTTPDQESGTAYARQLTFPAITKLWSRISRVEHWQVAGNTSENGNYSVAPLMGSPISVSVHTGLFAWDSLSQLAPGSIKQAPIQEYDGDDCIRMDISLNSLHLPKLLRPGVVAWLEIPDADFTPDEDLDIDLDGPAHEYLFDADMASSVPYHSEAFTVDEGDSLVHIYFTVEEVHETLLDVRKRFPDVKLILNIRPYVKIGDQVKLGGLLQYPIATEQLQANVIHGLYIKFIAISVIMILLVALILFRKRS